MYVYALLAQIDLGSLDFEALSRMILDGITKKNYWIVAGVGVWLLIAVLKSYGAKLPVIGSYISIFLEKKWTIPLFAILLSLSGGLVNLVMAGGTPTLAWFLGIIGSAAMAVFTHEFRLTAKAPAVPNPPVQILTAQDADAFLKKGPKA